MKRLLWTGMILFAGLELVQFCAIAQNAPPRATNTTPQPDVVISEVCYWPKEGGTGVDRAFQRFG